MGKGYQFGERHHRVKHSDAMVERARQMSDAGHSYKSVAQHLNVSPNTVRDWCSYRTRTRLSSNS